MFGRVEPLAYSLSDRAGRPIDVRDYLMRSHYIVNARQLSDIVSFICRKEPDRAPFRFEERNRGVRMEVHAPSCRAALPD